MTGVWQIQEAKNKLSEVVEEAQRHGPQVITRHGVETVVVLSCAEYRKLLLSRQPLSAFFRASPLAGVELDVSRDASPPRKGVSL